MVDTTARLLWGTSAEPAFLSTPNLTHRFAKGQSGNPAGRPRKGDSLAELIRSRWDKPARLRAIKALAIKAAEGDVHAFDVLCKKGWPEEAKGELHFDDAAGKRWTFSWQQSSTS